MISKVVIEGVRTHEHTEIGLSRLTCLVGPNGSGKSTVLEAFRVRLGERPLSWMRTGASSWKILFENSLGEVVEIGVSDTGVYRVSDEPIGAFFFRLDSEVLRTPSEFKDAWPGLGADGGQLASVLATWKLADQERFLEVLRQLVQVVPALENLRPNTTKVCDKPGFELLFDFISARGVPAKAVSEGTLLALGLLVALHEVNGNSPIVLLDDIDRGLHPDAQIELAKLLRHLAELKDLQIVMTTHSPYILDVLSPEEVCVLALDSTGTTRARQLSEIPGAERYRGMLSTGELWSSHGESWILESLHSSSLQSQDFGGVEMAVKSTDIGHLNPNCQRVIRRVGPSPTLIGQYTYELECERVDSEGVVCRFRYGANGPDIDGAGAGKGRRCPACQGGRPGNAIGGSTSVG